MFEFLSIIALALLLGLAFFVTVTLHELGHAIPALLMTRDEVTIYIGSFGSIFVISLGATAYSLFPNPAPRYTSSGYTVYSDTYQIFRLIRMKHGRY